MKRLFFLLLLINASIISMDSSKSQTIQLQVGDDKPCSISADIFKKCHLGKALLTINPNVPTYTFSKQLLLDKKLLHIEDMLMVLKILQDKQVIKKLTHNDIGHIFCTADFMMVSDKVKRMLAQKYKDLVGFKVIEKLGQQQKDNILWHLKSIKDVVHTVTRDGATFINLPEQGLISVHDIDLLDTKLNLDGITDICLQSNQLTKSHLKKIFRACPNVQGIDLSNNKIKTITKEDIEAMPFSLCFLDVSHNQLTQFPAQYVGPKKHHFTIVLQENFLSDKEVERLEELTKKNKQDVPLALAGAILCGNVFFFTQNKLYFGILCISLLCYFAKAIYRELNYNDLGLMTENQRQPE